MAKIKFTKAYQVEGTAFQAKRNNLPVESAEDPEDSPLYKVGDTLEVSDASARHYVNRGVAVIVGSKAHKAAEEAEAEAADEEKAAKKAAASAASAPTKPK